VLAEPAGRDAAIAEELCEIQKRLARMVVEGGTDPESICSDLVRIRADLRRLADENEEVRRRLGAMLESEGPVK